MAVSGNPNFYQPSTAPPSSSAASNLSTWNMNNAFQALPASPALSALPAGSSLPALPAGSSPQALPAPNGDTFVNSRPPTASMPVAPNFLATAGPAMQPFMAPYTGFNQPQIMYVPVMQPAPPPEALKTDAKSLIPETKSGLSPTLELEAPAPGIPGEPPSAQAIGYKVGKSVEHLLNGNPELLDDADRMQLDDPDALARQMHTAFHPLVKWVPDAVLNKAVGQMPVEYQDMAGRLMDWLNTPASQLKPITSSTAPNPSTPASRQPRPMSSADHTAPESEPPTRSHRSSPLDDLSSAGGDEPLGNKGSHSKPSSGKDPFADLFPADSPAAEEKTSLKDRLHLPSFRKDKAASEPSFEDLMI